MADQHESWTYGELDERSNRLANYLWHAASALKMFPIYGHRSSLLVWAWLVGILKAGAAFLILDPNYPPSRLVEYLRAARPKGRLQIRAAGPPPDSLKEFLEEGDLSCRLELPQRSAVEAEGFLKDWPAEVRKVSISPDTLAYISFTSGSTGGPKGVLGRQGPLTHFLLWLVETFDLNETDCFSMLSGLSHDPLHRDIFTPLQIGAAICVPRPMRSKSSAG